MTGRWVSFEEVKRSVGMEQLLQRYGLLDGMRRRRKELVGICPFHEESRGSLAVNVERNIFQCFGCKKKGNVLDFVAFMEGVDIRQAALLLADWFQIPSQAPANAPERLVSPQGGVSHPVEEETAYNSPLSFSLKNLDPDHPYLRERGLTKETAEYFGLGYCARGMMKRRIAIPIHNSDGELVGYAGRYPGEPPEGEDRYRMPPSFHKALELFNLHRVELAREEIVLVEGFFSVFWLYQQGVSNVVALMGSYMSERQRDLLVSALGPEGRVALLFDQDEAGRQCLTQCIEALLPHMYVKALTLPEGVLQPDALSPEQVGELFPP